MNKINLILQEMLDAKPEYVTPLTLSNNDVFAVRMDKETSYILKCFERNRYGACERELGMRECLRRFSDIAFPRIIKSVELSGSRHVLMERIVGDSLKEVWEEDNERACQEMSTLGSMLASLHGIPVAHARSFLTQEEVLYTEQYFSWMLKTITPYLGLNNQRRLLSRCYDIVTNSGVENVVIHGDFGPHQIIVDSQSRWFLVDFEYAAIGPFADDLGGTEVRLEQAKFPNIDAFLTGYRDHCPVLTSYEPVRSAFKTYNLLAMLTYTIAHQDKEPPIGELKRLEQLLAGL